MKWQKRISKLNCVNQSRTFQREDAVHGRTSVRWRPSKYPATALPRK